MVLFLGLGFSLGAVESYQDKETGRFIPIPGVSALKRILSNAVLYTEEEEGILSF